MKKLLFVIMMLVCTMCASAQVQIGVQADSARIAEYREQIGLDMSVPDFEVKKIDEKKMGLHLANLLRFYDEVKEQGVYIRMVNKVLGEQNEELEHVYIDVKKQKLMKVEKVANEITITYRLWLHKNPKNIKQADVSFHFKDGISESQTINEMFSNMSHYVQARERLSQ